MKRIRDVILKEGYHNIAIVGISKNAGKTVSLNYLLSSFFEGETRIGLTSSGRDGERKDVLTETEKPGICLKEGSIFTTTDVLYQKGGYPAEILELIEEKTPLGRVLVCRMLEEGYVEIAGLQTNSGLKKLCDKMRQYGAEICFIDGSIDRQASASPWITEAMILSVGASFHRSMEKSVEMASHMATVFCLKEIEEEIKKRIRPYFSTCILLQKNKEERLIKQKTALLNGGQISEEMDDNTTHLYIPGALLYGTLEEILNKNKQIQSCTVIVQDATKIFLTPKEYLILQKQGIKIAVFHGMKLLAITVNPYAPRGYYYDGTAFLEALHLRIPNLPIYDVVQDEVRYE